MVAWLLVYRFTPAPLHGWRRLVLRAFGAKIGAGAHPYPSARIWAPWNLEMAPGSCLGRGAECYSVARVRLGENCVVSQRVFLCAASHDHRNDAFPLTSGPIDIGPKVWIAAEAFIGPGVSIGESAVVGARAVVTRDVAAGDVVAGNPARRVAKRWRSGRPSKRRRRPRGQHPSASLGQTPFP